MLNKSSSTDSPGVVGKVHPEGADDEVESAVRRNRLETGLRPARVEGLGREGRTGIILVGSGLTGVGVAGCAFSNRENVRGQRKSG